MKLNKQENKKGRMAFHLPKSSTPPEIKAPWMREPRKCVQQDENGEWVIAVAHKSEPGHAVLCVEAYGDDDQITRIIPPGKHKIEITIDGKTSNLTLSFIVGGELKYE